LPTLPSLAEAQAAARGADLVALTTSLHFDHETAVSLADRFVDEPCVFLLESASAGPNARYSFLGFDPLWTWTWSLEGGGGNPIAALRDKMRGVRLASVHPKGARLGGPDVALMAGPAGFFGYDASFALEPSLGTPRPKMLGLPDAQWFMPRNFLVLDHLQRRLFVSRVAPAAGDLEAELGALAALVRRLSGVHVPPPLVTVDAPLDYDVCEASFTKERFFAAAEACLEEIRAGEIFQIQIGNRLTLRTKARPFDVFRHLRILNPSPYMFFYKFGEHHVLGASPEMMVGVQGGRVTHRPIAGTRRRTWDPAKDRAMREELTSSEKERAEHVMLVDLGRNDVGRVARPGSVKVEELMMVEEYSHVFHMVSQVTGELAAGVDAFEALAVAFPNGTVSGAPKIRAQQLINQHEQISREFYAGSLGLFDFFGNLRSTILIRSIHMAGGRASTQASAGIVYDSTPAEEWLETRNKMAACLTAMQNTR
jgi:anthranilate synthase component 1